MVQISDVERLLENHFDDGESWGEWHYKKGDEAELVEGLGYVEVVDAVGNSEGEGEYTHVIFSVVSPLPNNGDVRYFKMQGYYMSYDGTTWDGPFTEVTPVEKTIIDYVDAVPA